MANNGGEIEVEPTKELFVYIITRDIEISDAVIDLIDNCIDGAKRLRPKEADNFKGLWIKIEFDGQKFSIKDNCGGIPLEIAKKYAFRFGRAKDMSPTPGSVGQFGVGMKRALFKFGKKFEVKSRAKDNSFDFVVDVESWLQKKSWNFNLANIGDGYSEKKTGTEINVSELNEDTKAAFSETSTFNRIFTEIQLRQQFFIERGLKIEINGTPVRAELFKINSSSELKPARWVEKFQNIKDSSSLIEGEVEVEIYTGIGKSSPEDAGWYIICNGRVVLDADKSSKTGWGPPLPHYHNQYAQFRGYVFFTAEYAGILPWTTTKAEINENNLIYRKAKEKMNEMARPVITFLNAVDKEKDLPAQERVLTKLIRKTDSNELSEKIASTTFEFPTPAPRKKNDVATISYKRPKSKAAELSDIYGAESLKELGEMTFDEAYSRHVEE